MRITGIDAERVAIPIQAPIRTCYGSLGAFTRTLIRVRTDEGITGLGETLWSVEPARLQQLGQLISGLSPFEMGLIRQRVGNLNYYRREELAIGGIEIACLDAIGKALRLPVHTVLGGAVRDRIETAAYMFFRHPNDAGSGEIASAQSMAEASVDAVRRHGFGAVKVKGGVLPPDAELDALRLMHDELGDGVELRIDPQGGWTVPTAIRFGRRAAGLPFEYLEDPVWGMGQMAQVRANVPFPLATNTCVTRFAHLAAAMSTRPVDIVLSDIWYWSGVHATLALDTAAASLGLGLGMHANCEMGIGLAAMLHVAAVMPNLGSSIDVMHSHLVDDILTGEMPVAADGGYELPRGPGLGVELDEDKVARYAELARDPSIVGRLLDPRSADPTRPGWSPTFPAF
jgi:glucarate dehydratase